MTSTVLVVGAGLIGTSIGLALQGSMRVLITDNKPNRVSEALGRGAGAAWDGKQSADLVVVAVSPAVTAEVLVTLQGLEIAATYTHVASCQSRVQDDLEVLGADTTTVCGGHPLAGREVAGPAGATATLFAGRPWVACPSGSTSEEALAAVHDLARACGAEPAVMTPEDHDRAVALSSHLPQVTASALAARLVHSDSSHVAMSGPGLQDTTRVAASDADLWTEVLAANAKHVAPLVAALTRDLESLAAALGALSVDPGDSSARTAVQSLLLRGNAGRALVPVKRGVLDRDVAVVGVRVTDQPGQLSGLLQRAAEAGVNVEDIRVEHLPGRPTGVVELLVREAERRTLTAALTDAGLDVLGRSAESDEPPALST